MYSWSTVHRAPGPAWADRVPYTVGIVHLAEDYYMFSEILGDRGRLRVGAPVRVVFEQVVEDVCLPKFELT